MSIDLRFPDYPVIPAYMRKRYPDAAEDYSTLKKQYNAIRTLTESLEAQVEFLKRTTYTEKDLETMKALHDSEIEINQVLTNEVEELANKNEALRGLMKTTVDGELAFLRYFYDVVEDAIGPASDDVYEMIKQDFLDKHGYLPESYDLEDEI